MKKGFTLIELLVVIAIIAILAAILFPVFAQAKEAAKKTASLSNVKQVATAIAIYINDADDTYPTAYRFTPDGVGGTWRWNYSISCPLGWMGPGHAQGLPERMSEDASGWSNIILPYTKNGQILGGPGLPETDVYGLGAHPAGAVQTPSDVNLAYNGTLHAYNATAVVQPSAIPLVWAGRGGQNCIGNALAIPALNCPLPIETGGQCVYTPGALPQGQAPGSGPGSYIFTNSSTWWAYSQGVNWAFCDTSAKFRKIGQTKFPGQADHTKDPNVFYDSDGWATSSTGSRATSNFYTSNDNGAYAYLFRPDYQPGVN